MSKRSRPQPQQRRPSRPTVDRPSTPEVRHGGQEGPEWSLQARVAGNARWDSLRPLSETVRLEESLVRRRSREVAAARRAGCSWADIARVLGISRQAAMKRYADQVTDQAS